MFFKCEHPVRMLVVQKGETREKKDDDFEIVKYHLFCTYCNTEVSISYAAIIGGLEAFLERGVL